MDGSFYRDKISYYEKDFMDNFCNLHSNKQNKGCLFFFFFFFLYIRGFKTGYFDKYKNGTQNKFSLSFLACCIGLSLFEHAKIEFWKQ